jgi:Uma2 family endonuclease
MSVSRRWTVADLEQIEPKYGDRYEIINGELYVAHAPSGHHQYACDELQFALRGWSHETGLGMPFSASGLVFDPENDVIPDILWMSAARLEVAFDRAGHFVVAPELVVEVLSPGSKNERRDRQVKLDLYSQRGVGEYWIVDVRRREVLVYRSGEGGLTLTSTLTGDDVLESPQLAGFSLPVARLWAPPWVIDFQFRRPADE